MSETKTDKSIFSGFEKIDSLVENHPVRSKHAKWDEIYYYFIGEQWYVRTKSIIRDWFDKTIKKRENATYRNKVYQTINILVSKFIEKLTPVFSMLPENTTSEARQKAKISKQFCMYFWHESQYRKKSLAALVHFLITGNIYSKTDFDKEAYAEVDVDGKPVKKKVGNISFRFIHPKALYYDPYSPAVDDDICRWVIELSYIPKAEVERLYNHSVMPGKESLPKWADEQITLFKEKYWDLRDYKDDEGVLRIITWEREKDYTWTEKVWIGKKNIRTTKGFDNHPYNQAKDQDLGNIGEPKLEHGIQLQRDYNKMYTMFLDTLQHTSGYLFTDGEVEKGTLSGGGIIHLKSSGGGVMPPTYIPGAQVSPSLVQALQMEDAQYNDLMATHDHIQGKVPSGSSHMPGYIHQQLLGQDLARLGMAMVEFEELTAQVLMKAINLAIKHFDQERVLRIFGEENAWQMLRLKGDTLGVADVRVDFGSALPITKMEKIQFLIQLVQMQVIPPEKLTENIELGHIEKGLSDTLADAERARRQVDKIYDISFGVNFDEVMNQYYIEDTSVTGRQIVLPEDLIPDIEEWDNINIQLPIVETEMKSQRFENSSPFTQDMFRAFRQTMIQMIAPQQQGGAVIPPAGGGQPQGEMPPASPEEQIAQILSMLMQNIPPEEIINQGVPAEIVQLILGVIQSQEQAIQQIMANGGQEQDVIGLLVPMVMEVLQGQAAQEQAAQQMPPEGGM